MMRSWVLLLVLALVVGVLAVVLLRRAPERVSVPNDKLSVVASFYPLTEFARQVGGDHVAVIQVASAGVDVHDVQLSPQDIIAIQSALVFLYNGGGLEPWAERIHAEAETRGVRVINMFRALGLEEGSVNPHIWLDPVLGERHIEVIRDALSDSDPRHAEDYRANADRYLSALRVLDQEFRDGLATCAHREIIAAHDAFRHLAERYGLILLTLSGSSPEAEARPRQLATVARKAREEGIRIVFTEVLVSPRIAETFAREIGAEVRTLHPLEGLTPEELRQGKDYLSVMRENLQQLRAGLACR